MRFNYIALLFVFVLGVHLQATVTKKQVKTDIGTTNQNSFPHLDKYIKNELSKGKIATQSYTNMLIKISETIPFDDGDVALPYLKKIGQSSEKEWYQMSGDPKIKNPILHNYVSNTSSLSLEERLAVNMFLYKETPCPEYLESILSELNWISAQRKKSLEEKTLFQVYINDLDQYIEQIPSESTTLLVHKAKYLFDDGQYKQTLEIFFNLIESNRISLKDPPVPSYILRSYIGLDDLESCEKIISKFDSIDIILSDICCTLASKFFEKSQYEQAVKHWELAFKSWERFGQSTWRYFEEERFKNIRETFATALLKKRTEVLVVPEKISNQTLKFYAVLGLAEGYYQLNNYSEALPYYKEAEKIYADLEPSIQNLNSLKGSLRSIQFSIAYCYAQNEDYWKAVEYYKNLPDDPGAMGNLALIWINNLKSKRNALEIINRLKKMNKEVYNFCVDSYERAFGKK